MSSNVSYSQLDSYLTCGQRYYLERVAKIGSRPNWAQAGGSSVHKMTEDHDRYQFGIGDAPTKTFSEYLSEEVAELVERTGYPEDQILATGRKSKEWPLKETRDWWEKHGPIFVKNWQDWRIMSGYEIATFPDIETGELLPAIEIGFTIILGGAPVRGFIDRVMVKPSGELVVVDLKSGREPPSGAQLGLYGLAIEEIHGAPVDYGGFWMARTGMMGELWPLAAYSRARLDYEYGALAALKSQKIYLAHAGMLCGSCGVRDYCPSQGGSKAAEIDQPWQLSTQEPE